jgi:hypothetical protein
MHREENQSPLSGLSYAAVTWQLAVEAVVPLNNVSDTVLAAEHNYYSSLRTWLP